jgi:hypothetical protein
LKSEAKKILKKVSAEYEMPLSEVLALNKKFNSHKDQYALSMLIEDGYLGTTVNHTPPVGAERMREFTQAHGLHMLSLEPDSNGEIKYGGITSRGNMNPAKESVFIKAKGLLYLSEIKEKKTERIISFLIGFAAAFLSHYFIDYLKS